MAEVESRAEEMSFGQNSFLAFLSQERSSPVPTTLATFFQKREGAVGTGCCKCGSFQDL